jgi:predicted esterase
MRIPHTIVVIALLNIESTDCSLAYEPDWTAPIPEYVIDLFEPGEFIYSGGSYRYATFKYRLFVPRQLERGETYPLLLWTSGYGERGDDNFGQLMHLDRVFYDRSHPEKYRFFVLAMQNPDGNIAWCKRAGAPLPDEPATVLMEILRTVIDRYPIDQDRIYLSGVSAGGSACWEIGLRYPNRFAAIVPLASAGANGNVERLARLKGTPIWAFHCRNDPSIPVEQVRETVEALKQIGGCEHLTEIDAVSHDCWTAAFRDYGAMEWMLNHARGKWGTPPGLRPWSWWNYAIVVSVPAVIVMVVRSERKRRAARRALDCGRRNECQA